MSLFGGLTPRLVGLFQLVSNPAGRLGQTAMCQTGANWGTHPFWTRKRVREHFPRAREHKRVSMHGWKTRMSTLEGRKIIMRRILKGCHVLTH